MLPSAACPSVTPPSSITPPVLLRVDSVPCRLFAEPGVYDALVELIDAVVRKHLASDPFHDFVVDLIAALDEEEDEEVNAEVDL